MSGPRDQLFALDLPPLCCYGVLLVLSLGGGPWSLFAILILVHLALNRFGRVHARRLREQEAIPLWLGLLNVAYLLCPMFLLPTAFLSIGEVMRHAGLVPDIATHPSFVHLPGHYDPDHATPHGLALGPYGASSYWDLALKEWDIRWFGVYPTEWVRQFHRPWLTGVMQVGYLSYYFAPAALCVPLLFQRRWKIFRVISATLAACLVVTYLGYLLVPSTGPRFEGGIEALLPAEPGWFGAETLYRFLDRIEVFRWDAFPSGHIALGLCALFIAFRHARRMAWILLLPVVILCAATIYMGYHYVADVLAGAVIAALSVLVVPRFAEWWDRDR